MLYQHNPHLHPLWLSHSQPRLNAHNYLVAADSVLNPRQDPRLRNPATARHCRALAASLGQAFHYLLNGLVLLQSTMVQMWYFLGAGYMTWAAYVPFAQQVVATLPGVRRALIPLYSIFTRGSYNDAQHGFAYTHELAQRNMPRISTFDEFMHLLRIYTPEGRDDPSAAITILERGGIVFPRGLHRLNVLLALIASKADEVDAMLRLMAPLPCDYRWVKRQTVFHHHMYPDLLYIVNQLIDVTAMTLTFAQPHAVRRQRQAAQIAQAPPRPQRPAAEQAAWEAERARLTAELAEWTKAKRAEARAEGKAKRAASAAEQAKLDAAAADWLKMRLARLKETPEERATRESWEHYQEFERDMPMLDVHQAQEQLLQQQEDASWGNGDPLLFVDDDDETNDPSDADDE